MSAGSAGQVPRQAPGPLGCAAATLLLGVAAFAAFPRQGAAAALSRDCSLGEGLWCSDDRVAGRCKATEACAAAPASVRAVAVNAHNSRTTKGRSQWRRITSTLRRETASCRGRRLVFVGDSITEALRGTNVGYGSTDFPDSHPVQRYLAGQPKLFRKWFGSVGGLALGVAADETQHLLYRLLHGELGRCAPAVVVLLIGTNNLSISKHSPEDTARGIVAVVQLMCGLLPSAALLIQALLPRADCRFDRSSCIPGKPSRITRHVQRTNELVASAAPRACPRARVVDCGGGLLTPQGGVNRTLADDYLHPNPRGYEVIWRCLLPHIQRDFPELRAPAD
eukprot:TRINITY_DN30130_c0_g1_i2.p1 TRINITY_DN30130_c0_g1~~TRINITY_DN30130_c0_g1_i2.p1  ORF type:complete len:369 (+),score=80.46 TRINITY_DN30130_c0_g1_i2:99-1109(+)